MKLIERLTDLVAGERLILGITVAFGLLLVHALVPLRVGIVCGESMAPSLHSGNVYVLNEGYYRTHSVQRGDVVVLSWHGKTYLKRILALSGDTVHLVRSKLQAGDELVAANQLPTMRRHAKGELFNRYRQLLSLQLPEKHCYVVGDNLNGSVDSREFGAVPLSAIRGKVLHAPAPVPELAEVAGTFSTPLRS